MKKAANQSKVETAPAVPEIKIETLKIESNDLKPSPSEHKRPSSVCSKQSDSRRSDTPGLSDFLFCGTCSQVFSDASGFQSHKLVTFYFF